MYKNLNKFLIRFLTIFITIFCLLFLFDYLSTKNKTPAVKSNLTLSNSIQGTLLSTYFTVNVENSDVFNKYNLKKIDHQKFEISYVTRTKKQSQEIKNEILEEVKIIKDQISKDILFLINLNKGEFLLNSELAVVYSIITSRKDFLQITEKKQNMFNSYSYMRYIYYIFVSFIISILLILGIKQITLHKNQIDKFFKNLV